MKNSIYIICFLLAIQTGFAQLNLRKFEQIDSLQKVEKRKVIVFIHTDWCKFCQVFQSKTLKNEAIIKLLNEKFYFINFNAQEKRTIAFNKQKFQFKPTGIDSGTHELAVQLGTINGKINYPTLCFLNENNEIIFQHNGFINTKDFKLLLDKTIN